MKDLKITKGVWNVSPSGREGFDLCVTAKDGGSICFVSNWISDKEPNAQLIAEAGTVYNECGKSPRELVEENKELQTWKDAQLSITGKFLEFMQNHNDVVCGDSCHEMAIEFINERDDLKQQNAKLLEALKAMSIQYFTWKKQDPKTLGYKWAIQAEEAIKNAKS